MGAKLLQHVQHDRMKFLGAPRFGPEPAVPIEPAHEPAMPLDPLVGRDDMRLGIL